jgi:acetyl-CoA C-acetyltransferase
LLTGCISQIEVEICDKFVAKEMIDEVYLGHVVSAGCGQAPVTQAIRLAGLPTSIPGTSVNKVCSSGMKAVSLAANLIKSGQANCILAGGMESMSRAPYAIPTQLRCPNSGLRFGNSQLTDLLSHDGLVDAETSLPMGEAAERIAEKFNISRAEMDEYSRSSFTRAIASSSENEKFIFAVPSGISSDSLVVLDDGPKTFKPDRMATLRTPFRPETGRVTAATSSQLTDGAAVMVLMSGKMVRELQIKPIARFVTWADSGVKDAMEFPLAPALAIEKCYKQAKMSEEDISFHEINEAFAVVPLVVAQINKIPLEKINVFGGALALGHPLGASGARIIGSLISVLMCHKKKFGCASICNGGGGASAMIIEIMME